MSPRASYRVAFAVIFGACSSPSSSVVDASVDSSAGPDAPPIVDAAVDAKPGDVAFHCQGMIVSATGAAVASITAGQPFDVFLEYDLVADAQPSSNTGGYNYEDQLGQIRFEAGGMTFVTRMREFLVGNDTVTSGDYVQITTDGQGYSIPASSNGVRSVFALFDDTAMALASDAQPTAPPDVTAFMQRRAGVASDLAPIYYVNGELTSCVE